MFSQADDGGETRFESRRGLAADGLAGLPEQAPALGVSQDGVAAAGLGHHARGNLSGKGPLALPMEVLSRNRDGAALSRPGRGPKGGEGGRHHDVAMARGFHQGFQLPYQLHAFPDRPVHLPIPGNDRASAMGWGFHGAAPPKPAAAQGLSLNDATPGSFRPLRNSSDAPPPVEM